MRTDDRIARRALAAAIAGMAVLALAGPAALAYGPLYIFDYSTGTPFRWDVTTPIPVWVDGGHFASGTVTVWIDTPETCNAENEWNCGHNEEIYVEFANELGVARVADALSSWSDVPTTSFQAAVAGSFAEIGIGGADGDITGADDEFTVDANGNTVHEVIGATNNGGIHVLFDEDGSVMTNVMGAPFGVLGIASAGVRRRGRPASSRKAGSLSAAPAPGTTTTNSPRWPVSSRMNSVTRSTWRTRR